MTNPNDIAAELERLAACEAEALDDWGRESFASERGDFYRNHHATIIAALRSAGEVGELRKALEKAKEDFARVQMCTLPLTQAHNVATSAIEDIARRALGSAKE